MARHHSHRRQKSRNAARLGIAGGVTGIVGVVAAAGLIVVVRAHRHEAEPAPRTIAIRTSSSPSSASSLPSPSSSRGRPPLQLKTGTKLDLTTPDGYTYSLAAVKAGTADRPLASTTTPPPKGTTLAYIDYVLTNTGTQPALLDFPADLFVRRSLLPAGSVSASRCVPEPGAPSDMCTLPNHTDVVNTLGYVPPTSQNDDQYIPAGASYLVRIATDLPVRTNTRQADLGLYVWNPRFVSERKAVKVAFP